MGRRATLQRGAVRAGRSHPEHVHTARTLPRRVDEKAIRGVPWTVLSYVGSKAIAVVTTLVLARLLTPGDFGVIALAITVTSFLTWFADFGFSGTLILRQDLGRRGQEVLFTLMMASSAVSALVCVGLAPLAGSVFHTPRLTPVLAAMSAVLVIGGVSTYYEALLEREFEFRRRFIGYGVQSVINAAVSISLAVAGLGVWSLVAGQLASYAAFSVTLAALAPYRVRPRLDRELASRLFRSSRGFLALGITGFIERNTDNVVVGGAFGATRLGYYSMAFKLSDLSYWAISAPINAVTFPAFTRSRHRGEDIRPAFLSVLRLSALVGIPFGIVLSAAAEPLTRAVFGDKWLPMIGPLAILGIWAAIRPIESAMSWLLNSIGRAGTAAWVAGGMLVPLVPALILATRLGGLSAVAGVVLAEVVTSIAILGFLVRRFAEVSFGAMWGAVRPLLLAAPAMWLATWAVGRAPGDDHAAIGLLAGTVAGLVVYGAVISLFDRQLLRLAGSQIMRTLGRAATVPSG
jgi:O-antigen/teichoic acid export membrane protein